MPTYYVRIKTELNGVNHTQLYPCAEAQINFINSTEGNYFYDTSKTDWASNPNYTINVYWYANSTYNITVIPYAGYIYAGIIEGELSGTLNGNKDILLDFRTSVKIMFNTNGGTGGLLQQEIGYNLSTPLTNEIPTKVGYKFVNWYEPISQKYYSPSENITISETVTLIAQWTPNKYTITFNGNGGTTIVDSLEIAYETTQNNDIGQYIPQRQAYEFLGWYSSPTGGVQVYDSNGLCTNDGTYWFNDVCVHTEDYTLYAQWKALNIAYYKHEGEWKLCRTYIKVDNTWKPAMMYIKSNNKYIR